MGLAITTRQAYSEVNEFLDVISAENRNKVPVYLRELFNQERDETYIKGINPNIPIKNQGLKKETLAIIALLNLEYWCQDENEKRRLKDIYDKNQESYNELLQIAFNPDKTFKPKERVKENIPIVKSEETTLQKIIHKIKDVFFWKKYI